jgi:glutamate N-acetyltransferase/amino-acid N-acetyltransferase
LETDVLDRCLKQAVDRSFNMIVVDGDTSTNDMVLLTATGALDIVPEIKEFQTGLDQVLIDLAKQIARDGEGASRLIESRVKGAVSQQDARLVAKAIVRSPLVKTAIFGQDPNWGRVIAAAGYSGAVVDQEKISLTFSHDEEHVELVVSGKVLALDESSFMQLEKIMGADEVIIEVNLGIGKQEAVAWGCDLTYDYVTINAEYTT